ncbi:MAG: helix-turn-helix transcriptional regulator [Bacteroidales bacterium]|nr:helix-turn-helix transcriptional regulator [Bacteroidales bacterium]
MIISGAVITADIVNSSVLGTIAVNKLAERLKELINANQAKFLSFYRGDSFQGYLVDPYPAYKLALQLRTETKLFQAEAPEVEIDLRISLGIGGIDTPVTHINSAMGGAFVLSGRGLDEFEKTGRKFIIKSEDPAVNIALETISLFTDYLFSDLTIKQAEVLQHLLNNRTQIETARILKKSQSTINSHVQALGWAEMEQLLDIYNQCIQKIT